jgi:uncharacterized NAD(P)/FAD-binding protein YdhS
LLNAMARQMSALPDDHDHLVRWAAATLGPGNTVSGTTFLPRHAYGQYLRDTLTAAQRATGPGARLSRIHAQAVEIKRAGPAGPLQVVLTEGELRADVAVLATGNAPSEFPFGTPVSDRVIADPWFPGALEALGNGSPVVIVGTGLTMIDLAIAITGANPAARVHAVSRHGLLPRAHPGDAAAAPRPLWLPVTSRTTGPVRLGELMWQTRQAVSANPANWPAVMESLRPYVPGLWRRMPELDKRLFLRHAARLGIDATPHGAIVNSAGVPSDAIYTLGPPLRGLWYETTAVPEIREQAAALARRITADHGLSQRSGSAA